MIKIYDHTKVMKNSYFVRERWRVALLDLDRDEVRVSKWGLRLYFVFIRIQCVRLGEDTKRYSEVLSRYLNLLDCLVIPTSSKV
ncbi:hypothetical protein [Fulvivirga kasyanovii]|uniref:Uncharacterized protein n=1 Tax=Fulvivirga kasyanovii TaxID=396812 RepID=A0ABW9RZZ0_9BACT|nr:hypothetical protein [Fulvivirga kasyanovii]MTI28999.1 hypothetical protein [Fulvivirga kasyanovii]